MSSWIRMATHCLAILKLNTIVLQANYMYPADVVHKLQLDVVIILILTNRITYPLLNFLSYLECLDFS